MRSLIESLENRRLLTGNIVVQQEGEGYPVVVTQGKNAEEGMTISAEWRFSVLHDAIRLNLNGSDYNATQLVVIGSDLSDSIDVVYKPAVMQYTNGNNGVQTYIESNDGDDIVFVDAEAPSEDVEDTLDLTSSLYIDLGAGNDIWGGCAIGILKDEIGISAAYLGTPYYEAMYSLIEITSANSVAFLPDGTGYGAVGFGSGYATVLFDALPLPTDPAAYNISGLTGWTPWSSLGNRPAPPVGETPKPVKFSALKIDDVLSGTDVLAEVAA